MNSNLIDSLVSLVWVAFALIWILARFWKGSRGEKKHQVAPPPLPKKQPVQRSDASEPKQPETTLGSDLGDDSFAPPDDMPLQRPHPVETVTISEAEAEAIRPEAMPSEKASRFPKDFRLSGEEWQQAVVLSEILGPPIALKNQR
jgi:hypothetical protein